MATCHRVAHQPLFHHHHPIAAKQLSPKYPRKGQQLPCKRGTAWKKGGVTTAETAQHASSNFYSIDFVLPASSYSFLKVSLYSSTIKYNPAYQRCDIEWIDSEAVVGSFGKSGFGFVGDQVN